ncbi:MAG TPA: isochorismatase family cysteine hydrolase [Alphaproteobacteria bacterium]|nr:isochorismatase family cysteine hydrolase [Alphaproteobacteria bacterium]
MHKIEIPEAAAARALRFATIDPARTAVLVVDLQNFFVTDPDGVLVAVAREIIPNVNLLTRAFRAAGAAIVFIQHTISDQARFALPSWQRDPDFAGGAISSSLERLRPGRDGHALFAELAVDRDDLMVNKHRYSAFLANSSDIDAILRNRGIDTVVVTGTTTNICCESTARDAAMMDYRVFFVSDATATMNDAFHNATLLNIGQLFADIRSTNEMVDLLASAHNGA